MATIKFVNGSQRDFVPIQERAKTDPRVQEALEKMPGGEREAATFTHHAGSSAEPQLFEARFPANTQVSQHAHDTDEIIVIMQGELRFGKQSYGVGSSVYIPKMTLYSFQVGPEGATFLNFRPTTSSGAIVKEDFLAMRSGADAAP